MTDFINQNPLVLWYRRTPDRQRRRLGIGLLLFCFVVLLLRSFLEQSNGVKTALQVAFEAYVEDREKAAISAGSGPVSLPRIHVSIHAGGGAPVQELLIEPLNQEGGDSRILRLLSLAREARVFGLNRPMPPDGEGISLRVEDGSQDFNTAFRRVDISRNIQAETLMKLLTIYGKPVI